MAFVARMCWAQPARLDKGIVDCMRHHSSRRLDPQIIGGQGLDAAVWVGPSRGNRFPDGLSILVSGRPSVPRSDPDEGELQALHRLYLEQGCALVDRLAGSFGIVILDPGNRRCVFARDRLGFVPMFYGFDGDGLWVGDSVKPILASRFTYFTFDHEALYRYLHHKAFESPDTVVKEIKSVRPGVIFTATNDGLAEKRYWDIPVIPVSYRAQDDGSRGLEELLEDAIERGSGPGDRPRGIMVSGGLDSGVLSALSARLGKQDNVGVNVSFESRWSDIDESVYAEAVAQSSGIPLHKVEFTHDRLQESLPTLWWNNHLPTANSGFKLNLIGMQFEALGNPDTLMLGEGADTVLLYGWNWKYFDRLHRVAPLASLAPSRLRREVAGALERTLQGVQSSGLRNDVTGILRAYLAANLGYLKWKGSTIRPEAIDALFHPGLRDRLGFGLLSQVFGGYFEDAAVRGFSEQLVYASLKSYIPNQQLMNYHTSSNYFGAELACPFADERVVEYCVALPWYAREQKRVLKTLAERWLPHELVHRQKCAFMMPMSEWIKTHFRALIDLVFARETLERRGLFDPDGMASLKQSFLEDGIASWPDIWTFVVLEAWLRINLDVDSPACPSSIEAVFPELAERRKPQPHSRQANDPDG